MKPVRIAALVASFAVVTAGSAAAQVKATGYAFGALGKVQRDFSNDDTVQAGIGAEARGKNGLAGGAEIGWLGPTDAIDYGIGVVNANASYYVPNSSRFVPFVTGGYSLGFRSASENGWNVGAGVEVWGEKVGLRVEVRDQIFEFRNPDPIHFWGVRVGVSFR